MTDQERAVMQQALEALERGMFHRELIPLREKAITALRAALAQQQPEPVQEPLTDDEIMALWERHIGPISFARAVERKVRGEAE